MLLRLFIKYKITHKQNVACRLWVLSIKINVLCFVYYSAEQMVMILTQFSFRFLFSSLRKKPHKNTELLFHFVTAGYQSISIHGTVMIAHVVQGPNLIGLHFSAVFHIRKNKVSLWWGLSAHDCTTLINQTWQQWLHLFKSKTSRFQNENHQISVWISSSVMFFHLFLFFLVLITANDTFYIDTDHYIWSTSCVDHI